MTLARALSAASTRPTAKQPNLKPATNKPVKITNFSLCAITYFEFTRKNMKKRLICNHKRSDWFKNKFWNSQEQSCKILVFCSWRFRESINKEDSDRQQRKTKTNSVADVLDVFSVTKVPQVIKDELGHWDHKGRLHLRPVRGSKTETWVDILLSHRSLITKNDFTAIFEARASQSAS